MLLFQAGDQREERVWCKWYQRIWQVSGSSQHRWNLLYMLKTQTHSELNGFKFSQHLFFRMAFKYLGMAFFPLAICYCIYRYFLLLNWRRLSIFALQCDLQRAQGLVQLCAWQLLWVPPHFWFHHDDTSGTVDLRTQVLSWVSQSQSLMQLFINYKLKSVAHLPWRMMTYKVDTQQIWGMEIQDISCEERQERH